MVSTGASSTVEVPTIEAGNFRLSQSKGRVRLASFGVVCVWAFLGLYDTGLLEGIPAKSAIRFASIGLLALGLLATAKSNPGVRITPAFLACALLFMSIGVASSMAGNSPALGLLKLVLYGLVLFPLGLLGNAGKMLTSEYGGRNLLVYVGVGFLGLGLYRAFGPVSEDLGNTNFVSALSVCALPVFLLDHSCRRPTLPRWALVAAVLIAVVVCILNHSRGALGGNLAILGPWAVLRKKPSISGIATVVAIALALIITLTALNARVKEYAYKGRNALLDAHRANELETCMRFAQKRPFLGYGFGLSWRVQPHHFNKVLKNGRLSWYVGEFGNSTLAILAGGGLLLLLAFSSMVFVALSSGIKAMRHIHRSHGSTHEYRMLAAMFCGVLGLLVHSQAEGWILSPATMPTFTLWLFVGGLMYMSGCTLQSGRPRRIAR